MKLLGHVLTFLFALAMTVIVGLTLTVISKYVSGVFHTDIDLVRSAFYAMVAFYVLSHYKITFARRDK